MLRDGSEMECSVSGVTGVSECGRRLITER